VTIEPETVSLEQSLNLLGITRAQLVDIGILVGTDFNEGIKGIGPKTALKLLREHGTLEEVLKQKSLEIPHYEEIRKIFLEPRVTDEYTLHWGEVDTAKVKELLCEKYGFGEGGVDKALDKLQKFKSALAQKSLDQWF
jgi:flap endonuclease-1